MSSSKKLINKPEDVVIEMILGLVATYPHLNYLDGLPDIKVVLREGGATDKVAVISGGGSGHEPAHAGFVGQGMLSAAVLGDVFASPSVNAVLAAIRAVTGPPGCLLVVKNYTGDRLNFGLAAEQAKLEGFKVETVIVGDDCALPPPHGITGRRGLAGTLFVHKVAGAAAEAGKDLAEVASLANDVAARVGTMGVALTVCTLPGGATSDRLGPTKMEFGLGIHGEPGAELSDVQSSDAVVERVIRQILNPHWNYVPTTAGSRVAVIVNGLGGTPTMELLIAARKAASVLQSEHSLSVERVFIGSLMTSLDMAGMSLSILTVDDHTLALLDSPTMAASWPTGVSGPRLAGRAPVPIPAPPADVAQSAERAAHLTEEGRLVERAIHGGAEAVLSLAPQLNAWDLQVGDGDCGTTMAAGAKQVLSDLAAIYPLNDAVQTVQQVGRSVERSMGGTSGVLYTLFFRAAFSSLKALSNGRHTSSSSHLSPIHWAEAMVAGVRAIQHYGGAREGFRTMLDALSPAANTLLQELKGGRDVSSAVSIAVEAARQGAMATKSMQLAVGRSSYVPAELLGLVPDPGAMAAAAIIEGVAAAFVSHP